MNQYLNNSFANLIQNAIRETGITLPTKDAPTEIPLPAATQEDVLTAVTKSKKSNPYQDPAVQAVITEYWASQIRPTFQELQARKQRYDYNQKVYQHLPEILKQLQNKFKEAATDLTEAAKGLHHIDNLHAADTTGLNAQTFEAVMTALASLRKINTLTTAWKQVHSYAGKHFLTASTPYMIGKVTPEMYLKALSTTQGTSDPWALVRNQIPLELNTPEETKELYQEYLAAQDKPRRKNRGVKAIHITR